MPNSVIPTAATIKSLMASADVVRNVQKAAEEHGFKVIVASPVQVTIEGPKSSFERAFGSRLKSVAAARKGGKNVGGKSAKKRGAGKRQTVQECAVSSECWTWETPPSLPAEMKDAVVDVVFPQAVALH